MTTRILCAALTFAVAGFAVNPTLTTADDAVSAEQSLSLSEQFAQIQADFAQGGFTSRDLVDRIDSVIEQIELKLEAPAANKPELLKLRKAARKLRSQITGEAEVIGTTLTQLDLGGGLDAGAPAGGGSGGYSGGGGASGSTGSVGGGATGSVGGFSSGFGTLATVGAVGAAASTTSKSDNPGPIASFSSN